MGRSPSRPLECSVRRVVSHSQSATLQLNCLESGVHFSRWQTYEITIDGFQEGTERIGDCTDHQREYVTRVKKYGGAFHITQRATEYVGEKSLMLPGTVSGSSKTVNGADTSRFRYELDQSSVVVAFASIRGRRSPCKSL